MKLQSLCVCVLVLVPVCPAQPKKPACDDAMKFCWYDDEVEAWGHRWVAEDPKDTIHVGIAIRCVKSLRVCIRARSWPGTDDKNLVVTNIELMPVTHWDSQQITANPENYEWEPCERDSYIINRADKSVHLIASPASQSDTPACMNVHGKARTVTYKLSQ